MSLEQIKLHSGMRMVNWDYWCLASCGSGTFSYHFITENGSQVVFFWPWFAFFFYITKCFLSLSCDVSLSNIILISPRRRWYTSTNTHQAPNVAIVVAVFHPIFLRYAPVTRGHSVPRESICKFYCLLAVFVFQSEFSNLFAVSWQSNSLSLFPCLL